MPCSPARHLQLLGSILEVHPSCATSQEVTELAPLFFSFLSLEHPNNNVHNIRLCRMLVGAGAMSIDRLIALGVADLVSLPDLS